MNISLIALIVSKATLDHSSFVTRGSSRQLFDYTFSKCMFSHQISPVFVSSKASASVSVIDSDFGYFLNSAILVNSAFGGFINVDRTTDCTTDENCRPTITCPKAYLTNSKFHDFSTARQQGGAFASGGDTKVECRGCKFYRIVMTSANSKGVMSAEGTQYAITEVSTTTFNDCKNEIQSKPGMGNEHSFYLESLADITVQQVTVVNCGKDQNTNVAHVMATGAASSVKYFNASLNTLNDAGTPAGINVEFKTVPTLQFMTFYKNKNLYGNGDIALKPLVSGMTTKLETCNFIHTNNDDFIRVDGGATIAMTFLMNQIAFITDNLDMGYQVYATSKIVIGGATNCRSNKAFSVYPSGTATKPDAANWKVSSDVQLFEITVYNDGSVDPKPGDKTTMTTTTSNVKPVVTTTTTSSVKPVITTTSSTSTGGTDVSKETTSKSDGGDSTGGGDDSGSDNGKKEGGLSAGGAAGIAIAVIAVVGAGIIGAVYFLFIKKGAVRNKASVVEEDITEEETHDYVLQI